MYTAISLTSVSGPYRLIGSDVLQSCSKEIDVLNVESLAGQISAKISATEINHLHHIQQNKFS